MFGQVAQFATEVTRWGAGGFKISEVAEERMQVCATCDYFNMDYATCQQCGCFMPAKTKLSTSHCPIGKW